MYALKWIFIEPIRFIVQCLAVPLVMIPFQLGRGFWAIWFMVPAAYIALSIATGDWWLPVEGARMVGSWAYNHPALLYTAFRVICGLFAAVLAYEMAVTFWQTIFPPEPKNLKPIGGVDNTYTTAAIDNFRDKSAYGDAQHAKRKDIVRALAGSGGADEPFFET